MTRRLGRSIEWIVTALVLSLSSASATTVPPRNEDAERVVEKLDACFLDVMQRADELGYQGRYDVIAPVVRESFDLTFMARGAVGRYWHQFTESERQRWVDAFEGFLVSTFAHRFTRYSGQSFEIVGHKGASQNTLMVITQLRRPEDDDVRLDYRMRESSTGWKIVDIYSDGKVSEVATRHAECTSLLKAGGFEHLIASISAVTERHASE